MSHKDIEFYVCLAGASAITEGVGFFVGMAGCALIDSDIGDEKPDSPGTDDDEKPLPYDPERA